MKNIDDKIDMQHIDQYTVGYRDGIFYTLHQLKDFIDGENDINDTKLFVKASLKDLEIFLHYGANCQVVFTEWDKKFDKNGKLKSSKPTEAKIYAPEEKLIMTKKGYRSYREVMELIIETNKLIEQEKEDKIKALETKIKELEKK